MFKLKYLFYTIFSSSFLRTYNKPLDIFSTMTQMKEISDMITYQGKYDPTKGITANFLFQPNKNIRLGFNPLSFLKDRKHTIFDQPCYKKYTDSGKERLLYNHEILKFISEIQHFPISSEKLLNTFLEIQYQESALSKILDIFNVSYMPFNKNNIYITLSINGTSLFDVIKINPLYTAEEGVLPKNYITYEVGIGDINYIIKGSLYSDVTKYSTLLNHVLPIESFKAVMLAGYKLQNLTLYISGIVYYKYNIEELLKQYKNIKSEELHKVKLNTENNGKFQIEVPIGIEIMERFNIEGIFTNSFKEIIYIMNIVIIKHKIHELCIKITTEALKLKDHIESIQKLQSSDILITYSINLANGMQITFKFEFNPLKIYNNKSGWNPFVPTYFDPNKGVAVMPSFNVCISYDSKKNQINDSLDENTNGLNLNY